MKLEARGLEVRRGERQVLSAVDAVFAPGRITGVLGPNGAGKSTLLRVLAGLLPHAAGRVLLDDGPLPPATGGALGRRIAYLPQERAVHWPLVVRAVVALGRMPHASAAGRLWSRDAAAVAHALDAMDLTHLADRRTDTLSGGELARVLVARALAQETPVILADEPTAGLDPAHALALFEVFAGLAGAGRTVAVALHDLSLAARFCHDVVVMAGGRVAAAGPASEVMTGERLGSIFGVRMEAGTLAGLPVVVPIEPWRRDC
jgi:iron complex transport system ATP-binding protein